MDIICALTALCKWHDQVIWVSTSCANNKETFKVNLNALSKSKGLVHYSGGSVLVINWFWEAQLVKMMSAKQCDLPCDPNFGQEGLPVCLFSSQHGQLSVHPLQPSPVPFEATFPVWLTYCLLSVSVPLFLSQRITYQTNNKYWDNIFVTKCVKY